MKSHTDTIAMSAPDNAAPKSGFRWKWMLYLAVGVALVLAARFFHLQDQLKVVLDWVGGLGPWGVVVFIAIYIVATVLFIPGSVLTLGAGALPVQGNPREEVAQPDAPGRYRCGRRHERRDAEEEQVRGQRLGRVVGGGPDHGQIQDPYNRDDERQLLFTR